MVKSINSEEFLFKLDSLYGKAKEKYTVYLTFKRGKLILFQLFYIQKIVFDEKFKFKKNKQMRKKRTEDRLNQLKEKEKFSVLVRAKLKKERYHTMVFV